jgi:uncharacterized repeat protein (TIGR03803 family)
MRFRLLDIFLALVLPLSGTLLHPQQLHAQTKTTIFSFPGGGYGSVPLGGVIRDQQGNLYGTTRGGVPFGAPSNAFKLSLVGGQWRETVLYVFGTQQGDGNTPIAGLTFDSKGNLYGTTFFGGFTSCGESYGCGTVFELSPSASGGWTETVLNTFSSDANGVGLPYGGVTVDALGNVFGTTSYGGTGRCSNYFVGCGSVYELTPGASGWSIRFLHYFHGDGLRPDGGIPTASLLSGSNNTFLGTTSSYGVPGANRDAAGTVFEIAPSSGGGWNEIPLYTFGTFSGDGSVPTGGLVRDAQGDLYGTTQFGGLETGSCFDTPGCGIIFMLSPTATGWQETTLYEFKGVPDGASPAYSTLTLNSKGNLYGVTPEGGIDNSGCTNGCGTVFELSPSSSGWTETVLYAFKGGSDGSVPQGSLAIDQNGNLYGATAFGGSQNAGTVFEIIP